MRHHLLVVLVCLGMLCGLGVYLASSDDSFESFNPLHPSTILPIMASGVHALHAQVRAFATGLVEMFAEPHRERLKHHPPIEAVPQ